MSVVSRRMSVVSRRMSVVSRRNISLEEAQNGQNQTIYNPNLSTPITKKPFFKQFFLNLAHIFDLDLLKDPIYVNIMLGMSIAVFAELNFSVLTAFILDEFGLDNTQAATFMSVLGVVDIIFRFIAPYIGEYLNLPVRTMYILSLILLMLTRFCKFFFLMIIFSRFSFQPFSSLTLIGFY